MLQGQVPQPQPALHANASHARGWAVSLVHCHSRSLCIAVYVCSGLLAAHLNMAKMAQVMLGIFHNF